MALSWRKPPLTPAEEDDFFMLMLEDDTEDAAWMVMGDLQFDAASSFAHSLKTYARAHDLPWYVAGMLPIRYRWGRSSRKRQLAPDCFVAFAPIHSRSSYDLDVEGAFPPFVLEVVSPASVERDEEDKLRAYDTLGARNYPAPACRSGACRSIPHVVEALHACMSQRRAPAARAAADVAGSAGGTDPRQCCGVVAGMTGVPLIA